MRTLLKRETALLEPPIYDEDMGVGARKERTVALVHRILRNGLANVRSHLLQAPPDDECT